MEKYGNQLQSPRRTVVMAIKIRRVVVEGNSLNLQYSSFCIFQR